MSDQSQGPGWWLASDGRWYPPEAASAPGTYGPPGPTSGPAWGSSTTPPTWGAPPAGYGYAYGPTGPGAWGPPGLPSASGQAVASLVLGILALVMWCAWFLAIPLALIGLPLGISVLRRVNRGTVAPDGKGMAIAGVICSALALAIGIIWVVFIFALSNSDASAALTGGWS